MNGQLFEVQDLVRQRSFNNSTVLLDDGRYAVINRFFQDDVKGFKMYAALIEDGETKDIVSLPISNIKQLCILIQEGGVYRPHPVLQPFKILLR
jgi:hypothetical protein